MGSPLLLVTVFLVTSQPGTVTVRPQVRRPSSLPTLGRNSDRTYNTQFQYKGIDDSTAGSGCLVNRYLTALCEAVTGGHKFFRRPT
jgi:hypothetical protein